VAEENNGGCDESEPVKGDDVLVAALGALTGLHEIPLRGR
jgi:hypothetical protein